MGAPPEGRGTQGGRGALADLARPAAGATSALAALVDPALPAGRTVAVLLAAARRELGMEVSFVSEIDETTRVFSFVDGEFRTFDIDAGTVDVREETYCHRMLSGAIPSLVADALQHPVAGALAMTASRGIGAYLGVPIELSSGDVYGTLCCLSSSAAPHATERDVGFMRVAAALVAEQIERDAVLRNQGPTRDRVLAAIGDGVALAHQPIVELATGAVVGVEALCRFADGRSCTEWFDEAWAAGVGIPLEVAALRAALRSRGAVRGGFLAVNLSPEALLSAEVDDELADVDLAGVCLEITEHARILEYGPVRARIAALRAAGATIAVDDLGTGYSGFRHLVELEIDVLKLDRVVVEGIVGDRLRRGVASSIAAFADEVGALVVAEGIESADEAEAVQELGVRCGQGFLLGPPQLLDEAHPGISGG